MQKREFETALGPVWLWGEARAFEGTRPLVVAIAGAFAIAHGPLFRMAPHLADVCDVVTGHLPGNHCPPLIAASVPAYAAAYSQAIGEAFSARPVVVCGSSVGGLVALGLNAPPVRRLLLLDPPLDMSKLWPMQAFLQAKLRDNPHDAVLGDFIAGVFGVTAQGSEPRVFRHLLDRLRTPALAIVGEEPLFPQRPLARLPSLVDASERELLARTPGVSLIAAQGVGHNIPEGASELMVRSLRGLAAEAAGQPGRP